MITFSSLLALGVACGSDPSPTVSPTAPVQPFRATAAPNSPPNMLEVPIEVLAAFNVGGLQLELTYDPEVLQLTEVRAGPLARNALLESNDDIPGRLRLALVDSSGIDGDGAVVRVIFLPTGRGVSSSFALESVEASDVDLKGLVVITSPGLYTGPGDPVTSPTLSFRR